MNRLRERLAAEFIACLERDELPWSSGIKMRGRGVPHNPVSGTRYKGINRMALTYFMKEKGYRDARFMTFNQANSKGWHVRKGEKGFPVEFFSFYDKGEKKKILPEEAKALERQLTPEEYIKRVYIISTVTTVFNAEQIAGIPAAEKTEEKVPADSFKDVLRYRDTLIRNMKVGFKEGDSRSYYMPSGDTIYMPFFEDFESAYRYMAIFLHESAHATGHETRLNRPMKDKFGSEGYAKEELRAEISSCFVAQELAIDTEHGNTDNHMAYVQNWIKILKNEPDELFRAMKEAETISDYLIEKGEFFKERTAEKVTEKENVKAETGI